MKNSTLSILVICILVFLAFKSFKKHDDEIRKDSIVEDIQGNQIESKKELPRQKQLQSKSELANISPETVPTKENGSFPATEANRSKISLVEPPSRYSEKIEVLYERIKDIPIDEELKRLKPIEGTFTGSEERMFPYFYKGNLAGDPEKRMVRLNLSFRNFGPELDGSACFFIGTMDSFEAQAAASDGTMQVLRSEDPGYVVVNISNKYFLQIFQTSDRPSRRYKSILTIRAGQGNKKYSLVLEGVDSTLNARRAPTCNELSLPN